MGKVWTKIAQCFGRIKGAIAFKKQKIGDGSSTRIGEKSRPFCHLKV